MNIEKVRGGISKLWTIVDSLPEVNDDQHNRTKALYEDAVRCLVKNPRVSVPPAKEMTFNIFGVMYPPSLRLSITHVEPLSLPVPTSASSSLPHPCS